MGGANTGLGEGEAAAVTPLDLTPRSLDALVHECSAELQGFFDEHGLANDPTAVSEVLFATSGRLANPDLTNVSGLVLSELSVPVDGSMSMQEVVRGNLKALYESVAIALNIAPLLVGRLIRKEGHNTPRESLLEVVLASYRFGPEDQDHLVPVIVLSGDAHRVLARNIVPYINTQAFYEEHSLEKPRVVMASATFYYEEN